MRSIVVLGAGGFVGRAVIEALPAGVTAKAVGRRAVARASGSVVSMQADLSSRGSLDHVLSPGDVVINLVYANGATAEENLALIHNICSACESAGVSRLVHCSTAVVVGASAEDVITEETVCVPVTDYERSKLAIEARVLQSSSSLEVVIGRPTAVVGPEGRNLVKLADSLRHGSAIKNFLRASLFGSRPMHLVPVRNVAAALLHLARIPVTRTRDVYIIAADEDPSNNFAAVESLLREGLAIPKRRTPIIPLPRDLLSMMLRMKGRTETNLGRRFSSAKLAATGFQPIDSVSAAVRAFAESYAATASKR